MSDIERERKALHALARRHGLASRQSRRQSEKLDKLILDEQKRRLAEWIGQRMTE